jgi:hypothetical protein
VAICNQVDELLELRDLGTQFDVLLRLLGARMVEHDKEIEALELLTGMLLLMRRKKAQLHAVLQQVQAGEVTGQQAAELLMADMKPGETRVVPVQATPELLEALKPFLAAAAAQTDVPKDKMN